MTTQLPSTTSQTDNPRTIPYAASDDARREVLRDGTRVVVRSIRADDIEQERRFIEALSVRVRRFRFLNTINTPSTELLRQMTIVNPTISVAYVAVITDGLQEQQIGVARFSTASSDTDCEFAVVVDDAWQGKGLGTLLMRRLVEQARARGIRTLHSSDSPDNDLMRRFATHLQMQRQRDPQDATLVLYSLNVRQSTKLLDRSSAPDLHEVELAS